jgi:uncharacterized protein (DUF433 family)
MTIIIRHPECMGGMATIMTGHRMNTMAVIIGLGLGIMTDIIGNMMVNIMEPIVMPPV